MAFQIEWSETASEDLREIVKYIGIDDPEAATHLSDRIFHRIEIASEFPMSNRVVPEKNDELIREAILKPYRIIYFVDHNGSAIHILRIWHASRGIPDLD